MNCVFEATGVAVAAALQAMTAIATSRSNRNTKSEGREARLLMATSVRILAGRLIYYLLLGVILLTMTHQITKKFPTVE